MQKETRHEDQAFSAAVPARECAAGDGSEGTFVALNPGQDWEMLCE